MPKLEEQIVLQLQDLSLALIDLSLELGSLLLELGLFEGNEPKMLSTAANDGMVTLKRQN